MPYWNDEDERLHIVGLGWHQHSPSAQGRGWSPWREPGGRDPTPTELIKLLDGYLEGLDRRWNGLPNPHKARETASELLQAAENLYHGAVIQNGVKCSCGASMGVSRRHWLYGEGAALQCPRCKP